MTTAPGPLEARKQVRVRLRPNLTFVPQQTGGGMCYILQDPVSLRYFRLDEKQRFVVDQLDGRQTLEEIRTAYEQRFRPDRVSLEELEGFAAQLLDGGLAQTDSPQAGQRLLERAEKQQRQQRWAKLFNLLSFRIPVLNPDRLLDRLLPWLGFLFTPAFAVVAVGLVLAALALVVGQWSEFVAKLPAARDYLNLQNVLLLWAALGLVKVLHEFGHGLSCKAAGGQVTEMGVLLLMFFPSLYCDVTDSWRIPSRRQRIMVSAAGIYVELLIAALATFGWWLTDPSTTLHALCLALMVVCSVNTVVLNANPLMRFDGYYILSDWLEIPNLAEQASRAAQAVGLRWLGVSVPAEPVMIASRRGFLFGYAVASYLYRWVAVVSCLYLVFAYLTPYRLGSLGYLFAIASGVSLVGLPVFRLVKSIQRQGRLPEMKPARVLVAAGVLAVGVAVVCLVPFPQTVRGTALVQVEPDEVHRVVVPQAGGVLKELPVRDGQRVKGGDILAVLENPELEIKLRVNEADQALRLQQKSAYQAELTDTGAASAQAAAGLQQTEAEYLTLVREHAVLREQRDRLTLRAPGDGVVTGLVSADAKGKWLEPGAGLCQVANDAALRAVLLISAADHELVSRGSKASVHLHGHGLRRAPGVVTAVAQTDARDIPPQLSSRAGGEVASQHDAASGAEKPYQPHSLVAIRLHRADQATHPGVTGYARIDAGPQTLLWRLRRTLGSTFNLGI